MSGGAPIRASVVIPCWNSADTLEDCLESLRSQTLREFEAIFVDDGSTDATSVVLTAAASADARFRLVSIPHSGVSAARNAGLDLARGEYLFFADPDDTFSPRFLAAGVEALSSTGADYCVFPYSIRPASSPPSSAQTVPVKGVPPVPDGTRFPVLSGNEAILRERLPRIFGYSREDVLAWYAGTPLSTRRVLGSAWWRAYSLAFVRANSIRFDERIELYEDAVFNWRCILAATRVAFHEEPVYTYVPSPRGAISRLTSSMREIANKPELLRVRKELDASRNGELFPFYSCSCVFSLLQMLKIALTLRAPLFKGLSATMNYGRDGTVRRALREFPLSPKKPFLAFSVLLLRLLFR